MIERIFILHHTHVDIGYTGDRKEVCDRLVAMVDEILDLIASSNGRPDAERFRWIHEVSWPVMEYLRRGGARREELFQSIRDGRVDLTALYVNPTDLFDRDTFELSVDYACDLAKRHNLPLSTAMFSDCPGIAWSVVDVLAERGVRYLSAAPDFIMSMPLEVERPFWWQGQGGGRLLTWFSEWRNFWYAEGLHLKLTGDPSEGTERLLEYVAKLEQEGYRWKALAIHVAMDNAPPAPQLMDFVKHFNARGLPVQARMSTNREFFEFMEAQHGREFAVCSAAWPDWWANGHPSAAFEVSCSRRAKASLRRSKALSTLIGRERNAERLNDALDSVFMFDEHTWGASASVGDPWSLDSRKQWGEKRLLAQDALMHAERVERELLASVKAEKQVVVANPFDAEFFGPVMMAGPAAKGVAPVLRDVETGEHFVGQQIVPKQTAGRAGQCYVLNVPGKTVRRYEQTTGSARVECPSGLENEWFRIDWNADTGAVRGVYDKSGSRSLHDVEAHWSFAEIIHERVRRGGRLTMYDPGRGLTNPESKPPRPEFIRTAAHEMGKRTRLITGPVFNALITSGRLPGLRFLREVRLYHALQRIDILLLLDKQIVTEYESLYMAFPFASGSPEVWIENAGAVYRAGVDQLPGSATDWHSIGEYVAVGDAEATAVLACHDAPVIQAGDIHTGKWATRLKFTKGHIYSWLMNNMWFTNFPAYQEGVVRLAWSLTSHDGPFDVASAAAFASSARVGVSVM